MNELSNLSLVVVYYHRFFKDYPLLGRNLVNFSATLYYVTQMFTIIVISSSVNFYRFWNSSVSFMLEWVIIFPERAGAIFYLSLLFLSFQPWLVPQSASIEIGRIWEKLCEYERAQTVRRRSNMFFLCVLVHMNESPGRALFKFPPKIVPLKPNRKLWVGKLIFPQQGTLDFSFFEFISTLFETLL